MSPIKRPGAGNRTSRRGRGAPPKRVVIKADDPIHAKLEKERTTFRAAWDTHRLLYLTDDMLTAFPWLAEARALCFDERAARGLEQLMAALWVAQNTGE